MPPVKARPAPVMTATRSEASRARPVEALAQGADDDGIEEIQGRAVQATARHPTLPLEEDGSVGLPGAPAHLVPAHRGIDGAGPVVEAARQIAPPCAKPLSRR